MSDCFLENQKSIFVVGVTCIPSKNLVLHLFELLWVCSIGWAWSFGDDVKAYRVKKLMVNTGGRSDDGEYRTA